MLLFLHGGPGSPEYAMARVYDTGLEQNFTVCWWDQRGAGMSYSANQVVEAVTMDQMIDDTVEVTQYLQRRFDQEKIYLMGHSWGSFLGVNTVNRHPELYAHYIGIGQVTSQFQSEQLTYDFILEAARERGDSKTEAKILQHTLVSPEDVTTQYLMLRSAQLSDLGYGVFHKLDSQMRQILLPVLQTKEYTIGDKFGYIMGNVVSLDFPTNTFQLENMLVEIVPELKVPVTIIHGVYDMQVSYDLSKEYFDSLLAPKKTFYSFENSAHSPFMEEPERFRLILEEDILSQ